MSFSATPVDRAQQKPPSSVKALISQSFEFQKAGLLASTGRKPLGPSNTIFSLLSSQAACALTAFAAGNLAPAAIRDVGYRFTHERIITIWLWDPPRILDINLTAEARLR